MSLLLKTTANNSLRCISAGVFFRSLNWRRGVCTESRHERRISSSPWLMLSPRWDNRAYNLYNFGENRILSFPKEEEAEFGEATRIVGSSHGWLALLNHRRNHGELFLSNPLSGRRINLPPIHNLPIPEANLGHGCGCVEKLIISSSDPDSEDCRALMSFSTVNRLAFCCPGRRGTEWTIIGEPLDEYTGGARYYEDFVYCTTQQLFFAVTFNLPAELEAWDLRDPLSPSLVWSRRDYELTMSGSGGGRNKDLDDDDWWYLREKVSDKRKYLVASQEEEEEEGEVFYVIRYINPGTRVWDERYSESTLPAKTIDFDIKKIAGQRMDDGHNLDGRVMFVGGVSHGLVMPAAAAAGFPPNSICFTNDAYGFRARYAGHDHGIFDYDNKTISSCYYPCDDNNQKKIVPPPMWFTPLPSPTQMIANKREVCSSTSK